ncbi:hypothetical protein HZA43_05620 [Candidatus Peregrinibacteria bacterium]|nr:hypothetical protein [Candidatus Peregrinibacteria bacterium]
MTDTQTNTQIPVPPTQTVGYGASTTATPAKETPPPAQSTGKTLLKEAKGWIPYLLIPICNRNHT